MLFRSLAFFLCPEMPFFIYDSVVGEVCGRKSAPKPNEYQIWCSDLKKLLPEPDNFHRLVPQERLHEFTNRLDWLARRSLDLALYKLGEKRKLEKAKVRTGQKRS